MGRMFGVAGTWERIRDSFPMWGRFRSIKLPPQIPTEVLLLSGFNDCLRRIEQLEKSGAENDRRELQSILRCVLVEQASAHLEAIEKPQYQAEVLRVCHRVSLLRTLHPNTKMKVGDELDLKTSEAAIERFHMLLVAVEKLANQPASNQSDSAYSVGNRLRHLQTNLGVLSDLDRTSISQFHWQMVRLITLRLQALAARVATNAH